MKCHPDRVAEEHQARAEEIFKELAKCYEENDLQRVTEILEELESGNLLFSIQSIQEKDKLLQIVLRLRTKLGQLVSEISALKENETYALISQIESWEAYFDEKSKNLEEEITSFTR